MLPSDFLLFFTLLGLDPQDPRSHLMKWPDMISITMFILSVVLNVLLHCVLQDGKSVKVAETGRRVPGVVF